MDNISENAGQAFLSGNKNLTGLSTAEANERAEKGLANVSTKDSGKSVKQIILGNIFTYFNMIFCAIALVLIFEGCFKDLSFMAVVVANTAIGIVQELNAKKTLDKLSLMSEPTAIVIRDGVEKRVNIEELVKDDIIILSSGNQIPADAVVCDGEVLVNESLVTGESDEIKKSVGAPLLSGSFVVSGRCYAKLEKVGDESFASKLSADAKKIKKKQQPGMMKSLTVLIKAIGIIIVPFGIVLFICQKQFIGLDDPTNASKTAASVIGMIPEGLYLLTSIALALGAVRLAKRRTLVHDMKCIETLARVDVLCVDKTGTITENDMSVGDLILVDDGTDMTAARNLIFEFAQNMGSDNATIRAIKESFASESQRTARRAEAVIGFSSKTKLSAVSFSSNESYILGAPEFLLGRDISSFERLIAERAGNGERVVLFGEYIRSARGDIFGGDALAEGQVIPIAFITLKNIVRPGAKETFEYFTGQGVTVKVISGDNPLTVSSAALEAGIAGAEKYIDASKLQKNELISAAEEYTVFGRVTPEQKRILIRSLKKNGHTVAMTGDGVNDVLALKDADCSIAMASGSEAASSVSDLVLLDSDFSAMPHIVDEGRQVINNIEHSAALYLMKNIFSLLLSAAVLFLSVRFADSGVVYPLTITQIAWMSSLMIGIPSFVLTLEPNHERVKGKFLGNVLFRAFPTALAAFVLVILALLFQFAFKIPAHEITTVSIILFGIVSLMMLWRVCVPFNKLRSVLFGGVSVLFVLAMLLDPYGLFSISPLSFGSVLVLFVLTLLSYPVEMVISWAFEASSRQIKKLKSKFGSSKKKAKEI